MTEEELTVHVPPTFREYMGTYAEEMMKQFKETSVIVLNDFFANGEKVNMVDQKVISFDVEHGVTGHKGGLVFTSKLNKKPHSNLIKILWDGIRTQEIIGSLGKSKAYDLGVTVTYVIKK